MGHLVAWAGSENLVGLWAQVLQAVAAVLGFLLITFQLWGVKRAVHSDTQAKLYEHYTQVLGMVLEHADLRPQLYADKPAAPDETADAAQARRKLETMCELMAGLLEHGLLQKKNLPRGPWRECWEAFIRARINESPRVCSFVRANDKWYAKVLRDLLPDAQPLPWWRRLFSRA